MSLALATLLAVVASQAPVGTAGLQRPAGIADVAWLQGYRRAACTGPAPGK